MIPGLLWGSLLLGSAASSSPSSSWAKALVQDDVSLLQVHDSFEVTIEGPIDAPEVEPRRLAQATSDWPIGSFEPRRFAEASEEAGVNESAFVDTEDLLNSVLWSMIGDDELVGMAKDTPAPAADEDSVDAGAEGEAEEKVWVPEDAPSALEPAPEPAAPADDQQLPGTASAFPEEKPSKPEQPGLPERGMLMRIEVMKLTKGAKFFVKFDHGCQPTEGKVVVNCIFKLGEKLKYTWAFRGQEAVETGDQMLISLMPKLHGRAQAMLLKTKAFTTSCPACGKYCRSKYSQLKMHFPLKPCGQKMDVGYHTQYKVPKEMPEVRFVGKARFAKSDGSVVADLKFLWDIGRIDRLEKLSQRHYIE